MEERRPQGAVRLPTQAMSHEAFEQFVAGHGNSILLVARRYSASPADAEDVYQLALEAVYTKAPTDEPGRLAAWARSVAHNLAIDQARRSRRELSQEVAVEIQLHDLEPEPAEVLALAERDKILWQAVRRLRPDQARCLILRADELNYPEISRLTGFSYAKVNRCLSEGRKALLDRYTKIESGSDCERLIGALSTYADGECDEDRSIDVAQHLEHCLACRHRLREFRSAPKRAAAAFPVGAIEFTDPSFADRVAGLFKSTQEHLNSALATAQQQFSAKYVAVQQLADVATAKNAAVAVGVTASLVAGGVGVSEVVRGTTEGDSANKPPAAVESPPPAPTESSSSVTNDSNKPSAEKPKEPPREATAADVEQPPPPAQVDRAPSTYSPPAGQSAPADDFDVPSGDGGGSGGGTVEGISP